MEQFLAGRFNPTLQAPPAPGLEVQVVDGGTVKTFISAVNRVGTVAKGQPATVDYDETYGVTAIANATTGSEVYVRTAVFLDISYIGELVWMQMGGTGYALVDGTSADVAAGDALEVINGGTAFIKAASARDLATGAMAREAQAANSAVLVLVELIPERHSIESS